MIPWTQQREDKGFVPVLYMAMELSNRNWKYRFKVPLRSDDFPCFSLRCS